MRVNIAQVTPPSPSPSPSPSPHNPSTSSTTTTAILRRHSAPFLRHPWCKKPALRTHLRSAPTASFDGYDFPHHIEDFTFKHHHNTHKKKKHQHLSFSAKSSEIDVLEPSLLGIRPEPPDWPARDEVIRDCIARRASSIELPLSLRMIKMKQRFKRLEEERENYGDLVEKNVNTQDPISNVCCSTLYIVREVQSHALKIRGLVLDEELNGVVSKVQREMTSSFVWLFKEVFAKTPALMLDVMVLTSNFAANSVESLPLDEEILSDVHLVEKLEEKNSTKWGIGQLGLGKSGVPTKKVLEEMEEKEVGLWNSMVEEANEMKRKGDLEEEKCSQFISPVKIEIESDDYEEYYRTDLLYQIGLSQEPNNPLLLSNYAQFLRLVSHDYDRAEQCFKRAIQVDPNDAEIVSQYANFLWLVRKDLWRAEERFQQAMAAEPDNSYHASKYANFLWSTGGEETCYPLEPPPRGKS